MKKRLKNREGITLISLVVTVIILLILAGISIGMLSGDNGILGQAGNAKTQTDIEGEKEIINLAVVGAMNKSKYGDIDETYFKNELEKNNATVTKSGSKYKVTFPSERQYTVDQDGNIKEKKYNPNAMTISELNENASIFFGWDVINYAETLPTELQDTEWQLFYAGKLNNTDTTEEDRIYIISKDYIKNNQIPTLEKGGRQVEPSDYYSGSSDIDTNMQKFNKDYFKDYTSTYNGMKSVAYMLDITKWRPFATSKANYAEYAIGGPSVELLFTAYNKYIETSYEADAVSVKGYQVRTDKYGSFYKIIKKAISADTSSVDNPYSVSNQTSNNYYWLASPSEQNMHGTFDVNSDGDVESEYTFRTTSGGFRPVVLLDSNFTLEKTKDSNGNDAFKIVEQ